jgi:hypothetical protein
MAPAAAFSLLTLVAVQTLLLDRIAVTVGGDVITESQVLDEIRIVAFLNSGQPDFSPAARRRAAERLIDQTLIRREMRISQFPEPKQAEAQQVLDELKRKRFHTEAAFRDALAKYGITSTELLAHLRWELAALRFTSYRFRPIGGAAQADAVDGEMEAWLQQARAGTRIRFFKEAFERAAHRNSPSS